MGSATEQLLKKQNIIEAMAHCVDTRFTCNYENYLSHELGRPIDLSGIFIQRQQVCIEYHKHKHTDEEKDYLIEMFQAYNKKIMEHLFMVI